MYQNKEFVHQVDKKKKTIIILGCRSIKYKQKNDINFLFVSEVTGNVMTSLVTMNHPIIVPFIAITYCTSKFLQNFSLPCLYCTPSQKQTGNLMLLL
jgi:hypothetical protein